MSPESPEALEKIPLQDVDILTAALHLTQPRWNSQDVADRLGITQSAVARTWKKYFTTFDDLPTMPRAVNLIGVTASQGHCLMAFQVINDQDYLGSNSSVMRSPRRIPYQALLAAPLLNSQVESIKDCSISRLDFSIASQASLVIGTLSLSQWLTSQQTLTSTRYVPVSAAQWQALLPYLVSAGFATDARKLRQLHHELVTWAKNSTGSFSWRNNENAPMNPQLPLTLSNSLQSTQDVIADQAFECIVNHIWEGKLTSGDRITESFIAKGIHTTRSQSREALKKLASAGLLDYHTSRGVNVPTPTIRDLSDIYAARKSLGTEILKRCLENRDFKAEVVETSLSRFRAIAQTGSSYDTGNADFDFQVTFAFQSGMRNIPQMFRTLTQQLQIYIAVMGLEYHYPINEMVSDNEAIFSALNSRDFPKLVHTWNRKMDDAFALMSARARKLKNQQYPQIAD